MTFTFQNVWENRDAFIEACKKAWACEAQFKRLIEAKTKDEFMQVIYDNFNWINDSIREFEPKFYDADKFYEGFASVELNEKYGFIKEDGSYLVEPIFDFGCYFSNGLARVELDGKHYNLDTNGNLKEIK